jgi:O-acetyl-ADP-ribose deacetylase (regulator of RNase III)
MSDRELRIPYHASLRATAALATPAPVTVGSYNRDMAMRMEVVEADITMLAVDAIVNAANQTLLGGGGVDGAIHRAAGPGLLRACRELPEVRYGVRCIVGDAKITPGFNLPARYVIHTVGPVWKGGDRGEPERLASCYRESLALAEHNRLESIAFPAISCGAYGYPADRAVAIAVGEVGAWLENYQLPRRVIFCAFGPEIARLYHDVIGRHHAG